MSLPTIQIAPAQNPLPECSPNLMPFHLNYSGDAPISTYFRVKPTTLRDKSRDNAPRSDQGTGPDATKLNTETSSDAITSQPQDSIDTGVAVDINQITHAPQPKSLLFGARFVAAFRGRTVHGVTVNLPEGYSGVVLRAEDDDKSGKGEGKNLKQASSKMKKGKMTRKASRTDADEDVDMDDGEGLSEDKAHVPDRTLNPTATFSSIVLWNPDLPVDEARDEYLRSLNEWTQLAAEIHRIED